MLEKPAVQDEAILACLQAVYDLPVVRVVFLPLGADRNTAVYRAVTQDETAYFVKLRFGDFHEIALALPRFLSDLGCGPVVAPLRTKAGALWTPLDGHRLILYPYIEGRNGYEVDLTDGHWLDFGRALKDVHTAALPAALTALIPRETYSPHGRNTVLAFLERVGQAAFEDPVASKSALFLKSKREEILALVRRAGQLARALPARPLEFVVCHSDLHAGNVLIDTAGCLHLVDWDNPILAPRERDLMYIGGGQGFTGHPLQEEERLFYGGYGRTRIDPFALAYYRYERIVQDLAFECELIFSTAPGGEDRNQSLEYLMSNFSPNGTLEIACRADKTTNPGGGSPATG
jgi:spectinomycin phosphotransferase